LKLKAYYIELLKHLRLKTKYAAQEHVWRGGQAKLVLHDDGEERGMGRVLGCLWGKRDIDCQPCT